jgi:hypothetical protein
VQAASLFGDIGTLAGTVTEAGTGTAIQGASIQATLSITRSFQATTGAAGVYSMHVLSGTYTLDATAFGYIPAQVTGITVTEDLTTTVDFALAVAPTHLLSVTVVDANTGWPLYAVTSLDGTPWAPLWNDPVSGHFEVSVYGGWIYTLGVDAWPPGYAHQNTQIGPITSDTELIIELEPDLVACTAPGYELVMAPMVGEDLEASNGGFSVSGNNTSWEWGTPTNGPSAAHSGTNVWATDLDENYNPQEDSYLSSPPIDLSSQAGKEVVVSWWQWIQTEPWSGYGYVQVNKNNDALWETIYETGSGDVDLTWAQHTITVNPSYAVSDFRLRFHLWSYDYPTYPGWYIDDIGVDVNVCTPMAGGLVVGNVYDTNSGLPFESATVESDSGYSTLTAATSDPAVDDSFYVLFSPAGPHQFTASFEGYTPDDTAVNVVAGGTVEQDFSLTAGHLVTDPLNMQVNLLMGSSLTETLTITNNGSATATFSITEMPVGFIPMVNAVGPDVFIACADNSQCEPIASQLMAFGDIGSVYPWNARFGTPSLDDLLAYEVVLTWSSFNYFDSYAMGNVLADYVDAGGKVIVLLYWGLNGRFVDEDYMPMNGYDSAYYEHCLGMYDQYHPIMKGITHVCDWPLRRYTYLTPGSTAVANWDNGEIFVAIKDNMSAVGINMYAGADSEWTGQGDVVVHNAVMWLVGGSDVPWLSEAPITGTLPVSGSQIVNVTFDAGIPEILLPGDYVARLEISSDTPYEDTTVPVTMTVTPPDTYGKLEGTVQGLGYCDMETYLLNNAEVFIETGLGLTWTLGTDANGYFQIWMDEANTPLTITVSAEEHLGQIRTGVVITGQVTTTENFDLRWLEPCVSAAPDSISVELFIDDITTATLTLTNTGAQASMFDIVEIDGGFNPAAKAMDIDTSEGKLAPALASLGLNSNDSSAGEVIAKLAGSPAYALDLLYESLVYIPDITVPGVWEEIGSLPLYVSAGDFLNGDFDSLYVLYNNMDWLLTIDTATMSFDVIGSAVPQNWETWYGMAGSTNGVLYGVSSNCDNSSTLYTIDPTNGTATVIGSITDSPCIIDIAINADGEMYGVDINNDVLVRIDPATGAGTVVGPLGVDAHNYYQGLDFEEESGILYWASWNWNISGSELREIDTSTGNSTSIGGFPTCCVGGLAFATGGVSDAPWLFEEPISGTLPASTGVEDILVSFDASVVSQPGEYYASLKVNNNDPFNEPILVPVTMTVNPTPDYGLLEGTVTGLGYCDGEPAPVEGAEILIVATDGTSYTLETDANGEYSRWLAVAGNDYIVSASAAEHESAIEPGVVITGLGSTTIDFDLRWLQPCVNPSPAEFVVDVPVGYDRTVVLDIVNNGAVSSTFKIYERERAEFPLGMSTLAGEGGAPEGTSSTAAPAGYAPTLSKNSYAPAFPTDGMVAVFKDANPWGNMDVENFLAANSIPYEVHTSSEFGTLDFGRFGMIVFSGDQPQGFYDAYALYVAKFEAYVENGGFLNFFACDNGWNSGALNTPLPGGMALYHYGGSYNTVNDPAHPVMAGIPNPFYGSNAGYFTGLPVEAHVIASEQNYGDPSIVEYPLGVGRIIAFTQALEYLHYYGYDSGLILENTLLWGNSYQSGSDVPWLAEAPITGTVMHDSSFAVEVTFTAFPTMTVGGVYTASLILQSDDPINSRTVVSVTMNVVAPVYSLEVSADQVGSGEPGDIVTYTVTVTNTSEYPSDTYTVTLGASAYDTGLGAGEDPMIVVGPLAPGASATFVVRVHIPESALDGDHDTVQITVTSAGDPAQNAITNLTTNVYVVIVPPTSFPVYLPLAWKVYP